MTFSGASGSNGRSSPWLATLLSTACLAGCGQPPPDGDQTSVRRAFSNQLGGADCVLGVLPGTCLRTHEETTVQGLWFLRPEIGNFLAVQNAVFDASNASQQFGPNTAYGHFDNCSFQGSTDLINLNYAQALATVMENVAPFSCPTTDITTCGTPTTGATSLAAFAGALHTVQDFYSHTNWVEQGRSDLLDESLGLFPTLAPYSTLRPSGLTVVDGVVPPATCVLTTADTKANPIPYPDSARPVLKCKNQFAAALVSGDTSDDHFVTAPHECPPIVGRGHPKTSTQALDHNFLAKDDPALHPAQFADAVELARRQTTQEWCRFMSLVHLAQGDAGTKHVCDQWVRDAAAMATACPLLPPEALCCPAGTTRCGGACVDLQTDANNCGACANVCAGGASCVGGSCQNACDIQVFWECGSGLEPMPGAQAPYWGHPECSLAHAGGFASAHCPPGYRGNWWTAYVCPGQPGWCYANGCNPCN